MSHPARQTAWILALVLLMVGALLVLPAGAHDLEPSDHIPLSRQPATADLVADHTHTDISQIPDQWINAARALVVHYAHTSHGGQILSGLNWLEAQDPRYNVSIQASGLVVLPPDPTALRVYDGNNYPGNTSITPEMYWETADGIAHTHSTLDTGWFDISLWTWCGQMSYYSSSQIQLYLDVLSQLEQDYPAVDFIYYTEHTDGTPPGSQLWLNNGMVRDHVVGTGRPLFDFADIESYDPDGTFYPNVSDACEWCDDWRNNHPGAFECQNLPSCAHSHGLQCTLKGQAFWWLMARLVGWSGDDTPDLSIDKAAYPPLAGPGQQVTYTLSFANLGSQLAPDVVITDIVPVTLTDTVFWSSRPVTPTGAFSYTWELSDLGGGEGGVITVTGTVDPSVSGVFDLVNQATITGTISDGNLGNNRSIVNHTVDAEPPAPPILLSPTNGAVMSDTTPTLTWQASASPDAAGYWLDLDGNAMELGDVTSYTSPPLINGVYTWTVAAYDGVGNVSAYTDTWSFEIETTPPEPPTLLSPPDGAVLTDTTPTLVWTTSADAVGYRLNLNGSVMNLGDVLSYTTEVLADGTYTWTVAAYDLAGNVSPYPTPWSFEINAALPEILLTVPADGAVDVSLSAPVLIIFSEPIDTATFSYTASPDPGGWGLSWSGSDTVVTLTHLPWTEETLYTVTVHAADDLWGNPLVGAPVSWSFSTQSVVWLYLPLAIRDY